MSISIYLSAWAGASVDEGNIMKHGVKHGKVKVTTSPRSSKDIPTVSPRLPDDLAIAETGSSSYKTESEDEGGKQSNRSNIKKRRKRVSSGKSTRSTITVLSIDGPEGMVYCVIKCCRNKTWSYW